MKGVFLIIHVCDAIMGSGKSQSAITYMNAHPEKRFIYLTPYCNEAARIRKACPALHFIEPGIGAEGREIPKVAHTRPLLSAGKNVASTHAAFCLYDSIGIRKEDDHYEFSEAMEYYPSYIANLSDMIAIFDHDASNAIGNNRYALSASWYLTMMSNSSLR